MRKITFSPITLAIVAIFSFVWPAISWAQAPQITYAITSQWGTGFQTSVTITNPGTTAINNWVLQFTLPYSISSIWNASIALHSGNVYNITGDNWDTSIPAGGSVNFGFVGGAYSGSAPANPANCTVNNIAANSTTCSPGTGVTPPGITPPGTPTALLAGVVTSTSLTLSWTGGTQGTNPIASYNVFENGVLLTSSKATSVAISGLTASTSYTFTVAAVDNTGVTSPQSFSLSVTTKAGNGTGGGSGASTGTINFHLLLGAGAAQDSLTLDGNNYTDLIESNIIAGVMTGHLIEEYYPGILFDKDYLYGSILGQLLQENIETQAYEGSSNLIDPSPNQAAVMGAGQGGPYQINNYAVDMVAGTYTPAGHSLINYIALQQNIGYTFADAATQYQKATPPMFNNKYFGPILTAYFHYNDFVSLAQIGTGSNGWTPQWQPDYNNALLNFKTLPNNFLEVLLNVAYNQGYYGPLLTSYSKLGATATASTVATVNSFSSIWGSNDTYQQYPYQVRYYLGQFYDLPVPTTSATTLVTPQNHIYFSVSSLSSVFSNVFTTLSYVNSSGKLALISASQSQTAFNTAIQQAGVASTANLDLSNATDRAAIFTVLEHAISNLEHTLGVSFNATSLS